MFMRRTAARFGWLCALMLTGWPAPGQAQTPDDAGDCTGAPCPLIAIDTLLYVENRGVTRFFIDLNDHRFKLATDPDEVRQSRNAFLIPRQGAITVHIGAYLAPDDENPFDDTCEADVPASGNNCIRIIPQGSTDAGTGADVIIADLLLPGQTVAYRVEGLTDIPADFDLVGGAPNPFSTATAIAYHIAENRTTGLPITLALYDVAGRRVRTLVNERRFPGRFEVVWDGTGDDGAPVASGLYFCHMTAEGVRQTVSVVLVR